MKNTKHSIRTSLTALLLCFAMLLGTTFAWFTDVAVSSDNLIQAGSLDIALMKGTPNGDGTWTWVENNGEAIFDYDKWEPGYTTWAALAVENHGTLAAKWQAMLTLDGTPSILADVIEVYSTYDHIFDPDTRPDFTDGTWRKMGTVRELLDNDGMLLSGDFIEPEHRQPIVIALHMVEDAGNEYQGLNLGANFNIKVMATQASFENDSFGDDYDADAEWPDDFKFETSTGVDQLQILNNELVNPFIIRYNDSIYAELSAGTKLAAGVTEIKFSGRTADGENNLTLGEGDSAKDYDIHIEGIAEDNTQPIKVYLGKLLQPGLDKTSLKLYHEDTQMTRVDSVADFLTNNQFFYDVQTGEVVIYVDNFSVFTSVTTSAVAWSGDAANAFASGAGTEDNPYVIKTPEQFAYFRNQVDAGNSFKGKYVKLDADINLNRIPFDPIGFGYWNESKVDANGNDTNTVFMGTFDGGNHTIYNLYENCWELDTAQNNYSTYTYSTAGAGLFASIKNATIKNLMINGAEIVFECVDMGIVVGYAQGECHFENIVVANANIANYNRYTGGVVGEVSYGVDNNGDGFSHTFKNITVDSTVTVSGLWGSFGCGMGGVIGGKWGDATVKMENVVSAPVMDVYNDVVSAYQWYAFRGCGMLIGHTEEPYSDGRTSGKATADFLTCESVTVYYGDWVNQTYYQFAKQTDKDGNRLWYSDYPWVRVEPGNYCDAYSNIRYGIPQVNGVKVTELSPEEFEKAVTDKVSIPFDQLYGADRGMYGQSEHPGVTVLRAAYTTKTVYFENNQNWENVYIYYWCQNGNDEWDNNAFPGQPMTLVQSSTEGAHDVYSFKVPSFAKGFIFSDGKEVNLEHKHYQTIDIDVAGDVDNVIFCLNEIDYEQVVEGNKVDYKYSVKSSQYKDGYSTVYFKNGFLWDKVEMYYNIGDDTSGSWSKGTVNLLGYDGSYEYYSIIVPNYATTFNISGEKNTGTGERESTVDISVSGLTENVMYAPSGTSNSGVTITTSSFNASVIKDGYKLLYYKPSSDWYNDNARFAAYVFKGSKNEWYNVNKYSDGICKVWVSTSYSNIIFCRMNPAYTTNSWDENNKDYVWNQTADLTIPTDSNNMFKQNSGWDGVSGTWSTK